jgi:hypothetical protein
MPRDGFQARTAAQTVFQLTVSAREGDHAAACVSSHEGTMNVSK